MSLPSPMSDNDYDDIDQTPSTAVLDKAPDPNTSDFKKKFLTKGCKIKDWVHEKLKSFSWLCCKYGIAHPNKEMPYLHLYLEVDNKMTGINLKAEIIKVFDGNASEYIELRFVDPSDEIIIRPLSNMVHSKRDDEPNEESRGTLTLFSCKDGKHYALTCLHVGYGKVPEGADQFFYIRDKIKNDKLAFEKFLQKNKYSYTHKNSIKIPLGELFHYSFDLETDIMAILIDDKENEFTAAEIEMPSSFDAVFDNLLSKENEKVYKVDDEFGLNVIADLSRSVFDNNNKIVFRDIVAVKSDKEFLRPGESGCLVYYYNENNKKIPFAYGVAAVTEKNETYYVCMRLEDGLEKLGLLENVSFKDFSASKKGEPSVCQSNDNDSFEDSDAMPSSDFDGAPAIIVMGGVYSKHIREHISYEYLEKLKESAREGYAVLTNDGTAVDAVEKAVSILESSDLFLIGRGSPLNSEGEVECEAMIMDGDTLNTGAVISGRNFKNPVCLARTVMEKTPHCALSGDGALKFAQDNGLDWCEPNELLNRQRRVPPDYFNDYVRYLMEEGSFPADAPEIRPEEADISDCACAVAIDRDGKLACATSTGGIAGKLKGCVSDTALVGCGGYANNKGAAAATGPGEKLIKLNFSRQVVNDMEAGSAQEAVQDAVDLLKNSHLDGRAGGIAIDRHGNIGKAFRNDLMPWVSIKNDEMKFGLKRDEEGNYPFEFIENNGVV